MDDVVGIHGGAVRRARGEDEAKEKRSYGLALRTK